VAALGYLFGRRRRPSAEDITPLARRELRRAQYVARELGRIEREVRHHLAKHRASLARFKRRIAGLASGKGETGWKELCREAETVLGPTLQLATQVATAYDQIRQQTNNLMTFTEVRTDPLTGVGNRRGLDDALTSQFALMNRYDVKFSVAIFDIDHFKRINDQYGHVRGDQILRQLAHLLDESARETDFVARYGGEEFVVVMPQTDLEGSGVYANRLWRSVQRELPITVSGGIATAEMGDNLDSILARADAALYSAKSAGRNRIHRHNGEEIEASLETELTVST
jgi:diguanylate cyclase